MIPFNKPFLTGNETKYIEQAVASGKLSGNGFYTKKCQDFFEKKYGFKKCLLTTSCTDALEMAALLTNICIGDEVIVPSYTFVSSALAFVRQGAKIVFADSYSDNPNIDPDQIAKLITSKTKAIVVVHYAGVACDMDRIMAIANNNNLFVIEDAAQAIDSYYNNKALGTFGHLSTFSFHETKNIISGEGGMLCINDDSLIERSEIIWEKGTNRAQFFRGEINKYGWIDTGSSFLPSEVTAAFLWAQLENLDKIQSKRKALWQNYYDNLNGKVRRYKLPIVPNYAIQNGHMFYLICDSLEQRSLTISLLKENGFHAVFHYQSLHNSLYYQKKHDHRQLTNSDFFSDTLIRLPLFYELETETVKQITNLIVKHDEIQ